MAATADDRALRARLETELKTFVLGHQELFSKPRKHKTPFGAFGLQKATEVAVEDDQLLIDFAKDRGHDELYRVSEKVIKPAVRKRLERGEDLPGCSLSTGDTMGYKLAKALLENID